MNNPLISIITVSYNSVSTIEQTILSVIQQTYPYIEYLIIDGGSTDGTLDIIKKYENKIAYWVSEPDKGIYDAMNKGIKRAKGELIGIINSDDWYENIVDKVVSVYRQQSELCLFHGNIRFHKTHTCQVARPCLDLSRLYRGTILFHPTLFVPRKVYDQVGLFHTNYRIAADYDLMVRCYRHNYRFIYIDDVIANMRTEGESNRHQLQGYKEVVEIALKSGLPRYKTYRSFIYKYLVGKGVYLKKKLKNYEK